ncbi:hypothetical protein RND81_08G077300 [Saponaria officinalis]|uniref:Uncharacterized protein n=1 Tax=Saponaria officinalis TaxID=3572 RepID=A0AAW1J5J4_SAPOF
MGYTHKAAYYGTMQDSIASICKSILPFSFKKPTLGAAEQKLSKQQSDNLKWQQNSFHQILNLIGLHKHGLLAFSEVVAFRTHLLDTLIASKGVELEQPAILRDKLLFLQELLYAKCISEEEYHSSKRPLLQRLAVQGVELEARDVIVGAQKDRSDEEQEVWSTIDLKDEQSLAKKANSSSKNKLKNGTSSAIKHIKDTASVLGLGSFHKLGKNRRQRSVFDNAGISGKENVQADQNPSFDGHDKENDSQIKSVFLSEQNGERCQGKDEPKGRQKLACKDWGIDRFKRWKRTNLEDEITPLPLHHDLNNFGDVKESCKLVASPDDEQCKNKLLSDSPPSSFIIDKILGDKIKKKLTRIQTQLSSTNPNFEFSDDQMEAICTTLPVDKSDLKHLFSKSWHNQYGDLLLDVVKKEFKKHVEENENLRNATLERRHTSSKRWTAFIDDDQNCDPNLLKTTK